MSTLILCALATFANYTFAITTDTLIARGATWKYLDNGSNQGTSWRAVGFADTFWASGPAELGYGDGGEATVVGYGGNASNKYITTYFRYTFNVSDPLKYGGAWLGILRDDGAVIYLNGTEVGRENMPAGTISYTTPASSAIDDNTYHVLNIDPTLLLTGTNVIAVEIHQANITSSDISFNFELFAADELLLTREPYLQTGTTDSMTIRWRTSNTTESLVRYGSSPTLLTSQTLITGATKEHIVTLTGLAPDTKYYYSVGTTTKVFAGGDSSTYLITSPLTGTNKPTRIWVLGDSGTANINASNVRDGYTAFTGTRETDLWLMLGDNAYTIGTDPEFQAAVFNKYPTYLRKSVLWPTFGNHDAGSAVSTSQTGPYYDIFSLPKNAEAGGEPSGTEAYYSFDYGRVHFVCLDSQGTDRSPAGTMLSWLGDDLAGTLQDWIIVFFHHPPYTKGSHDSDLEADSGRRLVDMRENALPILEAAGVDLVLSGHSHSYERSFLLDGHYDPSTSFTASNKLDPGDGRMTGTGPYQKTALNGGSHDGAVYAVAGSSGQISGGSLNHPAMFISLNTLGSMVLDVDRNRLDAKFLGITGNTLDNFTIIKDSETSPIVAAITRLDQSPTSATVLRFKVEFSQYVTGVDLSDFALTFTSGATATLGSITGSGSTYIVSVNTTSTNGTVRLDITDNDTIINTLSAPLGDAGTGNGNYTAGESYVLNPTIAVTTSQITAE